jgi:glycolate oxidase
VRTRGSVACPLVDIGALIEELARIAGPDNVVTHPHQLRTYESDGLLQYRVTPGAVVLPGSRDEVRRIVRACYEAEVPWVARGAGSGLSGGLAVWRTSRGS